MNKEIRLKEGEKFLGTLRVREVQNGGFQKVEVATLQLSGEILTQISKLSVGSMERALFVQKIVVKLAAKIIEHKAELQDVVVDEVIHGRSLSDKTRDSLDITHHRLLVDTVKKIAKDTPQGTKPFISLHNEYYKPELDQPKKPTATTEKQPASPANGSRVE